MLLSRYHNIEYIHKLPFKNGVKLIKKAFIETEKNKAWFMWVLSLPIKMLSGNTEFEDFNTFWNKIMYDIEIKNRPQKSMGEILSDAEAIQDRIMKQLQAEKEAKI